MDLLVRNVMANRAHLNAALAEHAPEHQQPGNMLDNTDEENAPDFIVTDEMRRDAVNVVHEWAESELEDGEGYGDRLYALCVGVANDSGDPLTDDEAAYAANIAELVGDYLEEKGASSEDIDTLLGDEMSFDNDVAARVHDAMLDNLPQGEDAMMDDTEKFVLGDDDTMMDATYKKVMAVRDGKKVRIKKRVGGTVKLTAGQKAAVRKMHLKAFSGAAKMKRAKSMRLRRRILGK